MTMKDCYSFLFEKALALRETMMFIRLMRSVARRSGMYLSIVRESRRMSRKLGKEGFAGHFGRNGEIHQL